MPDDLQECCRILELEAGATWEDAKRSYRELVRVWHPDRFAHDPALERKAQEKLKQLNLAFERLEQILTEEAQKPPPPPPQEPPIGEDLFLDGQRLFFGNGVAKDTVRAVRLLRKSAENGFAPAQYLLGHACFSGEGTSKNTNEASIWWSRAAEQLHPGAQFSLGFLYHKGHNASIVAKVVKSTVDWQVGDAKIEAYKWCNLALTYGFGMKAGVLKQEVSTCLTEKQRNEARRRASAYYPKYPTIPIEDVLNQLITWFFEEGSSPSHVEMHSFYSKMQAKTGGVHKFRPDIRDRALEHLTNTFLGDAITKTGGFFKAVGAAWSPNRSADDWGRLIARNMLEFPYDYLSDKFIHQRENAINHIWLNLTGGRA